MAIKRYIIRNPEQLIELMSCAKDGANSMNNLARVWRAKRASLMAQELPPPGSYAAIEFRASATQRTAAVIKTIGGIEQQIGLLSYNKGLAYCRENLDKAGSK